MAFFEPNQTADCSTLGLCNSICRYDTDKNGYVDHREFLAKLGGELAPGDIHGPSTLIAEQSQQVMESMYQKQQVSCNLFDHFCDLWNDI